MKLSKSEAGKRGGIVGGALSKEIAIAKRIKYDKNPSLCLYCKEPKSYDSRKNKFCSRSCSAFYQGRIVPKRIRSTKDKPCLTCSKNTRNNVYCSMSCQKLNTINRNNANILAGTGSARKVKEYLLAQGHICNECKNSEWMGKLITLEMDHIDGNYENNNLTNTRLLCPNCHSLTDTYKIKNKGHGRSERLLRYYQNKSY